MKVEAADEPQVFVSFASLDGFHAHLLSRLRRQSVRVWVFERRDSEIPPGQSIIEECRMRIVQSVLFVPLVSKPALSSPWVQRELTIAFDAFARGELAILPVVADDLEFGPSSPEPFGRLSGLKGVFVKPASSASLEHAVRTICNRLQIEHQPAPNEDPRLPFLERLQEEINRTVPRHAYGSEIYDSLLEIGDELREAFGRGRHDDARALARHMLSVLEHEYPDTRFYYPHLLYCVALIECHQFDAAEERLLRLKERIDQAAPKKDWTADDTLYGLLGHIRYQRGQFEAALKDFEMACSIEPDDVSNRANVVLTRLHLGLPVSPDVELRDLASAKQFPTDKHDVELTRGLLFAGTGRREQAFEVFRALLADQSCPTRVRVGAAQEAYSLGRIAEVLPELDGLAASAPEAGVARVLLADALCRHGKTGRARAQYALIGQRFPNDWQLQYEALRGLYQTRDYDGAARVARHVLDWPNFGLPTNSHLLFIAGAAHWVLGERTQAEHDFSRSGKDPGTWHYGLFLRR